MEVSRSQFNRVIIGNKSDLPRLRGFLGTIFQGCVVLGILSMYSLGIFLSWDVLAFIAVLVPIFTLILAIFLLPDSPTWLISDGRIEFATEVTLWLRDRELVLHEIEELTETSLRADESPFPSPPSYCDASKTKPVSLIFLIMLINQLCGISVVETFFHGIFNWNDTVLPASLSSSIVGVCMLVSTLIAGIKRRWICVAAVEILSEGLLSEKTRETTMKGPQVQQIMGVKSSTSQPHQSTCSSAETGTHDDEKNLYEPHQSTCSSAKTGTLDDEQNLSEVESEIRELDQQEKQQGHKR
ncbi:solute carrier family 2, facilitated glucose transporter member 6-like [Eurytemora carolleeae]|uniref:solute carrier family 2, facilitated glucose transporter member 6-like n=1 Tax=Eurytemora carolleeae TaxID=1294199 RepID=UPI000C77647B|nr:solute carrier family 2, facilitated glucose transporter member 6-like [Eurytemora carolleeae]|eukprot:XP_023326907.1 solute carrier family 2, facilitated glucose transporter member 6-like [Eurytemora affinis]